MGRRYDDDFIVDPPDSMTVEHDHRSVLYDAYDRPLVRHAGFVAPANGATRAKMVASACKTGRTIRVTARGSRRG